ncbi:MAG TPA: AraD1 family protein [Gemmatimonadaceae bacterium]|nr:AraD1 family protein [Gemmatimonadaceae bacterium]
MTRLVQLQRGRERHVAVVDEPVLRLLDDCDSVYTLVQSALATRRAFRALIDERTTDVSIDYDAIYDGRSDWRMLLPIDHPDEPSRLLVSGTGLTHLGSAKDRQDMHSLEGSELTDSMKMFRWGVEGGRPAAGRIGISPEWFYKGNGTILRAHGEPLVLPAYGDDGGEEAEIAGVYIIGSDGQPWRIGMCNGNEFSDHKYEKRNYLNLASSKIRTCSLGPELIVDAAFDSVPGTVAIERDSATVWSKAIATGESDMCHSLQNVEHHHFKFESHRRPGDVHVHYFGACSLSFGEGVALADGDVMDVRFDGFGRALRNPLRVDAAPNALVAIQQLA